MINLSIIKKIIKDVGGATAIEYGLIASLVVIASIGAFESVANENTGLWGVVSKNVHAVMSEE